MNAVIGPQRSNDDAGPPARHREAAWAVSEEPELGPSALVSKLVDLASTLLKFNCLTIDGALTVRRARLLWTLASLDHAPCLTELTELDNAGSTQNCGRILNQLDDGGFLEVRADSIDGRMLRVYISDSGCDAAESFERFAIAFGKLIEQEIGEIAMGKTFKALDAFESIITSPRMFEIAPVRDNAPKS